MLICTIFNPSIIQLLDKSLIHFCVEESLDGLHHFRKALE